MKSSVTTAEPTPATAHAARPACTKKSRRVDFSSLSSMSSVVSRSGNDVLLSREAAHGDGADRAACCAEAAADADLFVLEHYRADAPVLDQDGGQLARVRRQKCDPRRRQDLD